MRAWEDLGKKHGLPIHSGGMAPLGHFSFDLGDLAAVAKTAFTQEMLKKGFLASTACYVSMAHTAELVDQYVSATDAAFGVIARAVKKGKLRELLEGPVCHPVSRGYHSVSARACVDFD